MLIDDLLSHLEKVRQTGPDRWFALCPAHDDKSPSLSVTNAGGKVLIHCFAGCCSEEILAAIGLTWPDLYSDDPVKAAYQASCAQHLKREHKEICLKELDRTVLLIAKADLKAGKHLSIDDRARVELAIERLGIIHVR